MAFRQRSSVAALAAASIAVATLAYNAHGSTTRHLSLGDGGVWVSSNLDGKVGRFNKPIGTLEFALVPPGNAISSDIDVLQAGPSVVMWDKTSSRLIPIDPALRKVAGEGVTVPAGSQVAMGPGVVAELSAAGDLRIARFAVDTVPDLSGVAPDASPVLTKLGEHGALAVSVTGDVLAAVPGTLVSAPASGTGTAQPTRVRMPATRGATALQVTAVGNVPVVADVGGHKVVLPGGRTVSVGNPQQLVLQQPSAPANRVAIGESNALMLVPLSGGSATTLQYAGGDPAAPVQLDGCVHAMWARTTGGGHYLRTCPGSAAVGHEFDLSSAGAPVFRVNRDQLAINGMGNGEVYAVDTDLVQAANKWKDLNQPDNTALHTVAQPEKHEGDDKPPQPVRDHYGARAGVPATLHVLDNDTDPEGDILAVTQVKGVPSGVDVTVAPDGQSIVATLTNDGPSAAQFSYVVSDGYKSASAAVTVALRPQGANVAPKPLPSLQTAWPIAPGATLRMPVLSDWRDDTDGDPLHIESASADQGTATATNDGSVSYTAGLHQGRVAVHYVVSDGNGGRANGVLTMTVLGPNDAARPAKAKPDVARAVVGHPITLSPLANDVPGADPTDARARLMLAGDVQPRPGLRVTTDRMAGTVTIVAAHHGVYLLSYHAAFGSAAAAPGTIRLDVADDPASALTPVAMPDTAVIHGDQPTVVDVVANDYDPAGDVLVVQSATPDAGSGLVASVVNGRALQLALNGAGPTTSVVQYTVTNGESPPVTGTVTVTRLGVSEQNSPPLPGDDLVTVRAGDAASVPVLDNDSDPDGDPISLAPVPIAISPATPGIAAAVSGNAVRFAAPATIRQATQFRLDYTVQDTSADRSTGHVTVNVVPRGTKATDQPPSPLDVETRMSSGDVVTIKIPVYGVDPDGDSVAVTGIVAPPVMGRLLSITGDTIRYQSYPTSHGTDEFTYVVSDAYGLTGTATVRVGIVPPAAPIPPVAIDDAVVAIPGRTVHVDVQANDVVAPGTNATVSDLRAGGRKLPPGVEQNANHRVISVRVPAKGAAPVVVHYELSDGVHTSGADLTVRGLPGQFIPPIARDDVAHPSVLKTGALVTADVLSNDDDPDGSTAQLHGLHAFAPDVTVDASGRRLVIPVADEPREVAYAISDADGQTAMAVVRVPGALSQLPRLKSDAPLMVAAGGSRVVSLSDIVEDPAHKPMQLTTVGSLVASPGEGVSISPAGKTAFKVTAVGHYTGPGAVTFGVMDGSSLQDPQGHKTTLTIPVQVGTWAPAFRCPTTPLDVVEGGDAISADIFSLCHVWVDPLAPKSTIRFSDDWATSVNGVTTHVENGSRLVLQAAGNAKPKAMGVVRVMSGRASSTMPVRVVAAGPLVVRPVTVRGAQADRTTKVDLAGYATSPLRDGRISVVDARQSSGGPATVSRFGSVVTITPGHHTNGTVTVAVRVTDVARHPERVVPMTITVPVEGIPDAPGRPTVTHIGNGELTISWSKPAANGSQILSYEVDGGPHPVTSYGLGCTVTGLQNGTSYSFTVKSINAVGTSDPSLASAPEKPDTVPLVPESLTLTPGDTKLDAQWAQPRGDGTPAYQWDVEIQPAPESGSATQTVTTTSASFSNLVNGRTYEVRVRARNQAKANSGYGDWSGWASEVPFGTPLKMDPPQAQGAAVPDPKTTRAVTVSWSAANGNGRDITTYTITEYVSDTANGTYAQDSQQSGPPSQFVSGSGYATSFTVAATGKFYRYSVHATNAGQKTSPESDQSTAVQGSTPPDKPATPTATDHASGSIAGYNGAIHVAFTVPQSNSKSITKINYRLNGGTTRTFSQTAAQGTGVEWAITGLTNGSNYTVGIQACNDAGLCGPWSDPSNQVTPYGPPGAPAVSASQSGTTVSYTWSGGGNNGRPVSYYHVCITGYGCQNVGGGSWSKDYGNSASWSISVYVHDSAGQDSTTVTQSGTTPPPPPPANQVSVSWGGKAPSSICGGDTSCTYLTVSWSNFSSGNHTVHPLFDGGYWGFQDWTVSGGSGSLTGIYGAGYCQQSHVVTAQVDGVNSSNSINTNQHGC